jgi:aminoglycoside 3-N-acetyltransferase I
MRQMLEVFASAFEDRESYLGNPPSDEYLCRLLSQPDFVALAALDGQDVVGGLVGYVLRKFEQERAEFYLYDLAVLEAHRRRGHAESMIMKLKEIAPSRGIGIVFVQADHGDEPAIALYTKLGVREDVMHFDILVDAGTPPPDQVHST